MSFEILDPTTGAAFSTSLAARSRDHLQGARVGVIWNGRPKGDVALQEILAELKKTHQIETTAFFKKPLIGNLAPEEIFMSIAAKQIDVVLAGVGD